MVKCAAHFQHLLRGRHAARPDQRVQMDLFKQIALGMTTADFGHAGQGLGHQRDRGAIVPRRMGDDRMGGG